MEKYIIKIIKEIDGIYNNHKDIINKGSDVRYVIAYLDEIECSIKTYFNGEKNIKIYDRI